MLMSESSFSKFSHETLPGSKQSQKSWNLPWNLQRKTNFILFPVLPSFVLEILADFFTEFNRKQIFNFFQVCRILWAINRELLVFSEELPARRNKNVFSVPGWCFMDSRFITSWLEPICCPICCSRVKCNF